MGLTERSFLERMELMGLTESRVVTNADRLRGMTDEELAKWLYKHDFCITPFNSDAQNWCEGDCETCIDSWLKSPVEEKA